MFQKVLIPLDGSPPAEKALEYLASLKVEKALLLRVSSLDLMASYSGAYTLTPEVLQDDRKQCLEYLDQARQQISGLAAETRYDSGDASERILSLAEEQECDLILLTSHGRSGMARFLLGSTAERVARHAHCPVMIVGRQALQLTDPAVAVAVAVAVAEK